MSTAPLEDRDGAVPEGERPVRRDTTPALTLVVVLLVVLLGAPQVWADWESGTLGLESVFYPVLGGALGFLAVSRR